MTEKNDGCSVRVFHSWSSHLCRKPVKRNGMCGVHAAAEERRAKNHAARKAADQESSASWKAYEKKLRALQAFFAPNEVQSAPGTPMAADRFLRLAPSRVTITIEALERLLREAGRGRAFGDMID